MWRSVMAMLLIPTLTFGQSEHPASSQAHRSTGADSLDEQSAAVVSANTALGVPSLTSWVKPFPRYNELRRGTSEELLVDIRLAFEKQPNSGQVVIFPYGNGGNGHDYLVASDASGPGIVPARVEFEIAQGFTVKMTHPPKSKRRRLAFDSHPLKVNEGDGVFGFKIHAASDVALGQHVLRANLSLQIANDSGLSIPQQIQLEIPITVVERHAKVKREGWPYPLEKTPTYIYALAPLMVLTVPLWIVVAVVCAARGEDCSC